MKVGREVHTIGLFADDVICYLEDPDTCISILIGQLETFGFCSGLKLNLTKTHILTFNYHPPKHVRLKYNLNWNATKIEHLGVTLTRRMDEIYTANYNKVGKEIRNDLARWPVLPLDSGS